MEWSSQFFIAMTVLLPVGLGAAGFGQTAPANVLGPGIHRQILSRPGQATVPYAISIPKDYSPSKSLPLVLALHYGGNPNGAAQRVLAILMEPALAELEAIIVAPESLGGQWNTTENDRAVIALLDRVHATYRIDPKRIAVTGFSMGGSGTWYFAGKYPERFTAAVPVAGLPPQAVGQWRMPVLAVHSRSDEVMPIGPTELHIKELQQNGVRAELIALTGISHNETYRFVDGLRLAVPWLRATWK